MPSSYRKYIFLVSLILLCLVIFEDLGLVEGFRRTVGTQNTPYLVRDINPGSNSSNIENLISDQDTVYFTIADPVQGWELWRSDGTYDGTYLVEDMPNIDASYAQYFTKVNDMFFFTYDSQLWGIIDQELTLLKQFTPGFSGVNGFHFRGSEDVNGLFLFFVFEYSADADSAADSANFIFSCRLWRSDGTAEGTTYIRELDKDNYEILYSRNYTVSNKTLFFVDYTPTHGKELWRSDGSSSGTYLVKDLTPGSNSSQISNLTNVGNALYFSKMEKPDTLYSLWRSDGTTEGTLLVSILPPGNPSHFTDVNGNLYFILSNELWFSDGTAGNTYRIKSLPYEPSHYDEFVSANGLLFFTRNHSDTLTYDELWVSDGTEEGTQLIHIFRDINSSLTSSLFGNVYLSARNDLHGYEIGYGNELWQSDGTESGTVMVKDIWPGLDSSNPYGFTPAISPETGIVFFTADDGIVGRELWALPEFSATDFMYLPIYRQ
jgi:ELWxxDGT repeat protein